MEIKGGQLFLGDKVRLFEGDSRDVLKTIPSNSIDSVVTDPPYALVSIVKRFGGENAAPAKDGDVYARASAGFMGKQWDTGETAFAVEFWAEVMRVLKPGGHVVAASGTRTYHRLAVAIEDAGFEIRDMISWLYGSGFPKSHDVSKGIAKRRDEDVGPIRAICRFVRAGMDAQGLKSRDLTRFFGDCNPRLIDHWAARDTDSQPALPTAEQWMTLKASIPLGPEMDAEFDRLNARKGAHSDEWTNAEVIGEVASAPAGFGDLRFKGDTTIRSFEDKAAQWQGWGTALKPACEPWVLARKPFKGTVAGNVLAHGTGAINVDGCRIETTDDRRRNASGGDNGLTGTGTFKIRECRAEDQTDTSGRFPANVIHDGSDEVVSGLPDTGPSKAGGRSTGRNFGQEHSDGFAKDRQRTGHDDNGGSAARFFYSAKADKMDRAGSKHPTVKPVDLMQYLCRLITPPGGTILDPFAGSGSTGEAAWREGFQCVLIERESEYAEDIRDRLKSADKGTVARRVAIANKLPTTPIGGLFGDEENDAGDRQQ